MEVILSSFVLVAVSEMGDKTQLLAFSLAMRFKRPWMVLSGVLVATLLNHSLASYFGSWISEHIPAQTMAFVLAVLFFGFGIWTLKPDTLDEKGFSHRLGPFLTTVILFFLAEMGDKTQFATVALAAKYQAPVQVTMGTTLGMLASDGLSVFLGEKLSSKFQMSRVRKVAAFLFLVFGMMSAYQALQ